MGYDSMYLLWSPDFRYRSSSGPIDVADLPQGATFVVGTYTLIILDSVQTSERFEYNNRTGGNINVRHGEIADSLLVLLILLFYLWLLVQTKKQYEIHKQIERVREKCGRNCFSLSLSPPYLLARVLYDISTNLNTRTKKQPANSDNNKAIFILYLTLK